MQVNFKLSMALLPVMFKKLAVCTLVSVLFIVVGAFSLKPDLNEGNAYVTRNNLTYPAELESAVQSVVADFPEVVKHNVTFVYDPSVTASVMQAQPQPFFLFESNRNRSYIVKMRPYITNGADTLNLSELPGEVLAGWLSHELGHLQDYLNRDKWDMIRFAVQYLTSENFMTKAECRADSLASLQGRAHHLIQMKKFIQSNDLFDDSYKTKINTLYPDTTRVLRFCDGGGGLQIRAGE